MSTWKTGKVTKVVSEQAVEVDGVSRHVADLRFGWSEAPQSGGVGDECDELADREHTGWLWKDSKDSEDGGDSDGDGDGDGDGTEMAIRRSMQKRQQPDRYGNYVSH